MGIARLEASKTDIRSDEIFTVTLTYSLPYDSDLYIRLSNQGLFEAVGDSQWQGHVAANETVYTRFRTRYQQNKLIVATRDVPLSVFCRNVPFEQWEIYGQAKGPIIYLHLTDFEELPSLHNPQFIWPDSLRPPTERYNKDTTRLNKLHRDSGPMGPSGSYSTDTLAHSINNELINEPPGPTTYTFSASYTRFRDRLNNVRPLQYFTVLLEGLNNLSEPPTPLGATEIGGSTTGAFAISTTNTSFAYYRVWVLLRTANGWRAVLAPATWNGIDPLPSDPGTPARVHTFTGPFPPPPYTFNVSDEITNINTASLANMGIFVETAHQFFRIRTETDTPKRANIFYNDNNTLIRFITTRKYVYTTSSGTLDVPATIVRREAWNDEWALIHEYGHCIQYNFDLLDPQGVSPPPNAPRPSEIGGQHYAGVRYNSQLAYNEGWANFLYTAVKNTSSFDITNYDGNPPPPPLSVNLNNTPPYGTSLQNQLHTYTPLVMYEGVEDELKVAALLWKIYNIEGPPNSFGAMHTAFANDLTETDPDHPPYNIMEFIRGYYGVNPTINASILSRARELQMFGGVKIVLLGQSIQNAINQVPSPPNDQYLIYVFNGTFIGNIDINAKSVSLWGEAPKNTIIQPTGPAPIGNTIYIHGGVTDYVRIDGFTISNGMFAIDASGDSRVYVSNNIITTNTSGVCAFYQSIVRNNVIKENAQQGFFLPANNPSGSSALIYNNTFHNNGIAIHYANANPASGRVLNNIMSGGTSTSIGISADNPGTTNGVTFDRNEFWIYNGTGMRWNGNINYNGTWYQDDPQYQPFFKPLNQNPTAIANYWNNGFQGTSPPEFENKDHSVSGATLPYSLGVYGGPEQFAIFTRLLPTSMNVILSGTFYTPIRIIETNAEVISDIIIDGFAGSLTLQPGVSIKFSPNTTLNVNGELNAIGTSNNLISFSCLNPNQSWEGITVSNSYQATVTLDYAEIRHTTAALTIGEFANFTMSNCLVDYSFTGLQITPYVGQGPSTPSPKYITNNTFTNVTDGILLNTTAETYLFDK